MVKTDSPNENSPLVCPIISPEREAAHTRYLPIMHAEKNILNKDAYGGKNVYNTSSGGAYIDFNRKNLKQPSRFPYLFEGVKPSGKTGTPTRITHLNNEGQIYMGHNGMTNAIYFDGHTATLRKSQIQGDKFAIWPLNDDQLYRLQ